MRLALNFARIDPTKGGAETYLVDLCQRLVAAGHEVDLFANSWKADALPAEVRPIFVDAPGWTRSQRIWNFARNSEAALIEARGRYDCSVGFINTWHHDVIIPQGGVHAASLEANAKRFPAGWRRQWYRLGKQANPKAWIYRAIEARQGRRRLEHGSRPRRAPSRRRSRSNPRRPERDRRESTGDGRT
jgi:UDP-glucose:(heptosyl)LPS alpha-1,3-glucosyltransferase